MINTAKYEIGGPGSPGITLPRKPKRNKEKARNKKNMVIL
tara:strand:+ start:400 stop:519 length:120 start_codon:yes stop_codon:yes gene_type:complete